jgi:hypothetical protein
MCICLYMDSVKSDGTKFPELDLDLEIYTG